MGSNVIFTHLLSIPYSLLTTPYPLRELMKPTILVVEDESSIQNVIRTYLESADYKVVCIEDGREVLPKVQEIAPDLIILDLNLPGMDGLEVAARVRQESEVYTCAANWRA